MEIKTHLDHPLTNEGIVRWLGGEIKRLLPNWQARLATALDSLAEIKVE